ALPKYHTDAHAFCSATAPSATGTDWGNDPALPGNTTPTKGIAPFGSGAGRDYLGQFEGGTGTAPDKGCVTIARSSGAPRGIGTANGTDTANMHYYAFGLDTVTWASTSNKAPATLSIKDIQDIYFCVKTNWSQFPGGTDGEIIPYFPQAGS